MTTRRTTAATCRAQRCVGPEDDARTQGVGSWIMGQTFMALLHVFLPFLLVLSPQNEARGDHQSLRRELLILLK